MRKNKQDEQIEPFFITEETEAEMINRGYTFEPPNHTRTVSLPQILAALSDEELARWADELAELERYKRLQEG